VHFGETPKWSTCNACDVCGSEPEWLSKEAEDVLTKRRRPKMPSVITESSPVQRPSPRPQVVQPSVQSTVAVNPALRDFLREWRRETATQQNVPAYVVMHDTTLDEICRVRPGTIPGLLRIVGIGERKAEMYGRQILDALKQFSGGARATAPDKKITPSEETIQLIEQGKTLDEIALIRGRRRSTIVSMVSDLVERGLLEFQEEWIAEDRQRKIEAATANLGLERFSPIKDALPEDFTYDEIRLVVAKLRRAGGQSFAAPA
jgi:ATP-dependent DNA helicase RecQ